MIFDTGPLMSYFEFTILVEMVSNLILYRKNRFAAGDEYLKWGMIWEEGGKNAGDLIWARVEFASFIEATREILWTFEPTVGIVYEYLNSSLFLRQLPLIDFRLFKLIGLVVGVIVLADISYDSSHKYYRVLAEIFIIGEQAADEHILQGYYSACKY